VHFCIRDDDTSFFTPPDVLDRAYGEVSQRGPISLSVIPFCRAGTSKGVPERFRGRWSLHPLHANQPLVHYLRAGVAAGRFEIMLHGFHHDEQRRRAEFAGGNDLARRVADGRRYLEDLLGTAIRVFVPPHNTIGRAGLLAVSRAGLHLGGTAGIRAGWPLISRATWGQWLRLRGRRRRGELGIPWILDLKDHREIPGNAITPHSRARDNEAVMASALATGGVFCAATHYWELDADSVHADDPPVGEQLRLLIHRAMSHPETLWRSVGDIVSDSALLA
jgi:uncharacterized protein DUF2334